MGGPLEGVRVLELTALINGAAAGYMLGDLGAEVIKIEDPVHGDLSRGVQQLSGAAMNLPTGINMVYESSNRSKKGIVLDLKAEAGREILYRLVEKSDVFITNYRESVLRRLGATYEILSQRNPRLIYGWTSGYGRRGPDSEKRAYDVGAQARSGLMWACGDRDSHEPSELVGAIVDQVGATMLVYGVLAALFQRERTGQGQLVETSMLASAIHMQAHAYNTYFWGGRLVPRQRARKRARNPLYNAYRCEDGRWILIGDMEMERFWDSFWQVLGVSEKVEPPQWTESDERRSQASETVARLDGIFATKTREEWLKLFAASGSGITVDPIYDLDEAANDPQVLANGYLTEMDHPVLGHIRTVGVPVKFSKAVVGPRGSAPEFGQHTEEVLLEIGGYSWQEIEQKREGGALGL